VKRIFNTRILILLFIFLLWGCSTQKNTFVNRNFHSITTKYNGYFNARESYNDGVRKLNDIHEDNYEDILSIFRYGSKQQASTVASNMDRAYQKASLAIRKHSMNIKGVEYNRFIDDSYYLIARSHYFKNDDNLAILTFQYIIRQFESPLKYSSKLWIAKTHIKLGQFDAAQQVLEKVTENKKNGLLDKETLFLYNQVYADFYLQQDHYALAIPFLAEASVLAPKRKDRTRLTFLLAQVYHRQENYALAQQTYRRVLRMNPDFQMAFQSRINMAMAFDNKSGDSNFILSELNGMLRDNKNREFRDQVYYALGQFSMRQNQEPKAIEYYNQSLENFRGNRSQRGITYLRLAELSFKDRNYLRAAMLYDSTMVYLSQEYPGYPAASEKHTVMKELGSHLSRIEREDSLQRLAGMGNEARNAVFDVIIQRIRDQEEMERQLELERAQMRQQMARNPRNQAPGAGEGGWYFYNPTAINFGRNEFYAKWGERQLQDLWRISNKRIIAFGETGGESDGQEEEQPTGANVTRASLMQNVPTTPEKMKESNARLAEAHYGAGIVFKDKMKEPVEAIKHFEQLVTRFPEAEDRLLGAYFLNILYTQAGNTARAENYKSLIVREYPDTDYARILSDPNYRVNLENRQNSIRDLYTRAYNTYSAGDYSSALQLIDLRKNEQNAITKEQEGQFAFLKALILAQTSTKEELLAQLNFVSQNFEGTAVSEPAKNLLAYLGSDQNAQVAAFSRPTQRNDANQPDQPVNVQRQGALNSIFSYNPESVHFFVIVVNNRSVQIRQLRNDINNFNRETYGEDNLNMSTLFFDQNRQLITITNFRDGARALRYGQQLLSALHNKDYDPAGYTGFAISVDNYPLFYQDRKFDEYLEFFNYSYRTSE
jgi:tetratricopeptide (TPR) repeat protein